MREEWYVVPTRYALRLREVPEDQQFHTAPDDAGDLDDADEDRLLDAMSAQDVAMPPPVETPPRRKLPRRSSGRTKK